MKQVYYKQNEKFEYEFFNDKECKEAFEFNGEDKNLYIELKEGNISLLFTLSQKFNRFIDKVEDKVTLYISYLPYNTIDGITSLQRTNYDTKKLPQIKTLKDITPNYSKYIPNDCAVVFLNKWEYVDNFQKYKNTLKECPIYIKDHSNPELCKNKDCACQGGWDIYPMHNTTSSQLPRKVILFTPELTSTNIKQINDTAKVLKENFGIEWVGVFTELCFADVYILQRDEDKILCYTTKERPHTAIYLENLNKLITTNATGLFEPLESEHLQVIDCKEIFEEYIKTNE